MSKLYPLLLMLFMSAVTPALARMERIEGSNPLNDSRGVSQNADITGRITSVKRAPAGSSNRNLLGSVFVEDKQKAGTVYDKASVSVTTETRLYKEEGGTRRAATFDDLQVGAQVRAVFTGAALLSYPVRATAGEIVIVAGEDGSSNEAISDSSTPPPTDLPPAARTALNSNFFACRTAEVSDAVRQFFTSRSQEVPPQVLTGDFNGDGRLDYAVNIFHGSAANRRQTIAVLLARRSGRAFSVRILETVPFNPNQAGTGLYLTLNRKGEQAYNYEAQTRFRLRTDAVAVNNFEKASWIYVYRGNRFRKVFTGD